MHVPQDAVIQNLMHNIWGIIGRYAALKFIGMSQTFDYEGLSRLRRD